MAHQQDHLSIHIRRGTADDAEAVWRLHVESIRTLCAADYTAGQIEAWVGPKRPADYVAAMEAGETLLVAELGNTIVGFASCRGDTLRGLYVAPGFVRRGAGKALLAAVEADARDRGVVTLSLHSTLTAAGFYLAHGYADHGRMVRRMHAEDIPCVQMSKDLTRSGPPAASSGLDPLPH